jgi:hypothetical protein
MRNRSEYPIWPAAPVIATRMGVLFIKYLEGHYVYAGVSMQVFRVVKILLGKYFIPRKKELLFETGGKVSAKLSQSNVWEPGVNPGRLRHCNGYKLPMPPTKVGKAGVRFEAEVRIPV